MPVLAAAGTFLASSAGATLAATAATVGSSIYAANKGAKAAKQAGQQAAQAADREIALQREARDKADQIFTPYVREGDVARRMINGAMGIDTMNGGAGGDTLGAARADYYRGFDASPFMEDARYGAEQSLNALRSTNAAMGRGGAINSGKAMRAAQDIQTGYRGQATQNYLASLGATADVGFNASGHIGDAYQGFASNAGNAMRYAANAQGQSGLAGAQAYANAASDIGGFAGYALGNYQDSRNRVAPPRVVRPVYLPRTSGTVLVPSRTTSRPISLGGGG